MKMKLTMSFCLIAVKMVMADRMPDVDALTETEATITFSFA